MACRSSYYHLDLNSLPDKCISSTALWNEGKAFLEWITAICLWSFGISDRTGKLPNIQGLGSFGSSLQGTCVESSMFLKGNFYSLTFCISWGDPHFLILDCHKASSQHLCTQFMVIVNALAFICLCKSLKRRTQGQNYLLEELFVYFRKNICSSSESQCPREIKTFIYFSAWSQIQLRFLLYVLLIKN